MEEHEASTFGVAGSSPAGDTMMKVIISFERCYDVGDPDEALDTFSHGLQTGEWPGSGWDIPTRTSIYTNIPEGVTNVEQLLKTPL